MAFLRLGWDLHLHAATLERALGSVVWTLPLPARVLRGMCMQLRYGVNERKERERAGKRRPTVRSELDDLKSFPDEDEE